ARLANLEHVGMTGRTRCVGRANDRFRRLQSGPHSTTSPLRGRMWASSLIADGMKRHGPFEGQRLAGVGRELDAPDGLLETVLELIVDVQVRPDRLFAGRASRVDVEPKRHLEILHLQTAVSLERALVAHLEPAGVLSNDLADLVHGRRAATT